MYSSAYLSLTLPGVFKEDDVDPLAMVTSAKTGNLTAGEGEQIYCEIENTIRPNKVYTILRPFGDTDVDYDGVLYQYIGTVRLDKISRGGDYVSGVILSHQSEVTAGDLVVPYENTKVEILFPT